nr:MAG TPA: Serine/Threonine Kinase [Caudoviricetes sp.]
MQMRPSGELILHLSGGIGDKQCRREARVVVELDPGFCFVVNKPHERPDFSQLLKCFFLAPHADSYTVAMDFFRLVAVVFQHFVHVDFIKCFFVDHTSSPPFSRSCVCVLYFTPPL